MTRLADRGKSRQIAANRAGPVAHSGAMENQTPSAELQARIDSERQRLLAEQNIERDLTGQRLAPLEAGDDEALDAVEASINACRDRQLRIQERLEILEQRQAEAQKREEAEALQRLREQAEAARILGEKLIRQDYAKQAKAMASTLAKLYAIDQLIVRANRRIERANDEALELVDSPNRIRCIPYREWTEKVIREVGMNHPAHPYHLGRNTVWGPDRAYMKKHNVHAAYAPMIRVDQYSGEPVPETVEAEVEELHFESGESKADLFEAIRLPRAEAEGGEFWGGRLSDEELEQVTAALLKEAKA